MQKFFVFLSLVVAYCESAGNYGSGSSGGGSFSGFGSSSSGGGGGYGGLSSFGNSGGSGSVSYVGGGSNMGGGPHQAAIETHRTVEVRPVNIPNEPAQPQVIEVGSEDLPVTVHFKSQSSRVFVQQTHVPGQPGETEHTSSEDEPHRVVHEVVKPVIQEIREIIQPYRRLVQQIQPVIEQTHTIVAKGEPRPMHGQQGIGGGGLSGGSSYGGSSSGGYGGSGGGISVSGGSSGGGSSYGGSSSYSSRQGLAVPSNSATKGQTISIDNTGSGSSRIYSSLRSDSIRRMSSRARA